MNGFVCRVFFFFFFETKPFKLPFPEHETQIGVTVMHIHRFKQPINETLKRHVHFK